jgi:type I restriction enzyme R subunit
MGELAAELDMKDEDDLKEVNTTRDMFNSENKIMTREERVLATQATIFALLNDKQKEFIDFVLSKYIESGFEELDQEKLPILLTNKYQTFEDAGIQLGDLSKVKDLFIGFQSHLYQNRIA